MEEINLSEFINYYLSRIGWVLFTIVIVMIGGNLFNYYTRVPMYQSSTTIILAKEDKEEDKYTQTDAMLNQKLISTYREIIKSRTVLRQVIKNENLKYSVEELSNCISITNVEDTEIIKITVSNKDKNHAVRIANAIAPIFKEEVMKIYNINNVSVLDKAIVAKDPYNINYLKENVIYVLIGFVLASGVIFTIFYFDTSIKSTEELEDKLGLTVLGVVPKASRR
mgnify:FL=1